MIEGVGRERIVYFGFSKEMFGKLAASLPAGSILVIEEPDVVRKRNLSAQLRELPLVSGILECHYLLPEALERLVCQESRLARASAVVPGGEYAVAATARAAAMLGLPGAGERAGAIFRDKFELRRVAAEAGVRNPRHALVRDTREALAFFDRLGKPCVLKPTGRQASVGVQILAHREQLAEAWAWSADPDEGPRLPDRGIPSRVLIEEAVTGREFSVEMLYSDGVPCFANVTAKQVFPGRFPVEVGHVVPAPTPATLGSRLIAHTERLATAAGFGTGALHCEWIVTGEDEYPVLVECAARLPGDDIVTLISLAYDFPMVEAYLRTLLGGRPSLPMRATEAAAIRFLLAPPGRITALDGLEAAAAAPGVVAARATLGVGNLGPEIRSSWDRAGSVLTRAEDADRARVLAESAAAMISFASASDEVIATP